MAIKRNNILLLVGSTFLGAVGQLLFKLSLSNSVVYMFVIALAAYIISALVYFYVISQAQLSWAYGVGGLSYIFAVLLAALFIESVPAMRLVGVVIIAGGVLLVALS